jgi:hypothetical protein
MRGDHFVPTTIRKIRCVLEFSLPRRHVAQVAGSVTTPTACSALSGEHQFRLNTLRRCST